MQHPSYAARRRLGCTCFGPVIVSSRTNCASVILRAIPKQTLPQGEVQAHEWVFSVLNVAIASLVDLVAVRSAKSPSPECPGPLPQVSVLRVRSLWDCSSPTAKARGDFCEQATLAQVCGLCGIAHTLFPAALMEKLPRFVQTQKMLLCLSHSALNAGLYASRWHAMI